MTSAAEHAFGKGAPLTLGVEEEFMLLDAATFELSSRFDEVAEQLADGPLDGRAHPELMQSTLEVASVVCRDVDELRSDLETVRRGITAAIEPLGLRLAGAGAHPFSRSEDQRITTRDRYRWLVEQLQYVARRALAFGMHVHVAVPEPDLAMHVMESLLAELPVLLALSASSPFWRGEGTGLASPRQAIFAGIPRPRRVLHAHSDLREHAPLRAAAALLLLRGLPRHGRHDGGSRRDRRLHLPLVGRAPASSPRHGRDPRDGRAVRSRCHAHAGRVRAGERGPSDRRGPAGPRSACPPPAAGVREQVVRGALRPGRAAHGSGRRPARAPARLGARPTQRRAA